MSALPSTQRWHSLLPSAQVGLGLSLVYALAVLFASPSLWICLPAIVAFGLSPDKISVLKRLGLLVAFLSILALSYYLANQPEKALMILLRPCLCIGFLCSIFAKTNASDIARATSSLGFSYKLCAILFLTIKFIASFSEDIAKLHIKLRARGFKPRTNWHTYRTYASFVGFMLFSGLARSLALSLAMRARGFNEKALKSKFNISLKDYVWIVGLIGAVLWHFKEGL